MSKLKAMLDEDFNVLTGNELDGDLSEMQPSIVEQLEWELQSIITKLERELILPIDAPFLERQADRINRIASKARMPF